MAKMFYTLEEAETALGKSEDEIKQYAREGRLREFRDGQKLMFKADQVEALKAQLGGDDSGSSGSGSGLDQINLGPSDSGVPIGMIDSQAGGSASGISLADDSIGNSPGGGMVLKDDTALAADLGLSGSMGGMPSPAATRGGGSGGSGLSSGSRSGSGVGINVFGSDDSQVIDASAQTNISSGSGADQINLEGVGSGSGLLDLTRESDDTSLGAHLKDEVQGISRSASPGESAMVEGTGVAMQSLSEPRGGVVRGGGGAPLYVEEVDPMAPAFGAAALACAAIAIFGIFVIVAACLDTWPPLVKNLTAARPDGWNFNVWIIFGIAAGLSIIFFVVGMTIGKSGAKRA